MNIQTSRMLGQRRERDLKDFLAAARGFFLTAGGVAFITLLLLSPHLFNSWKFDAIPGIGSYLPLSLVAAGAVGLLVLNSYINNLNYGCGNVVWLIVPSFLLAQFSMCAHWLLARQHSPLWLQYLPYVFGAFGLQLLGWYCIRISHPELSSTTVTFDRKQFVALFGNSFWMYLSTVSNSIYVAADRFFIIGAFGAAMVPAYAYNTRLCELASFVINSANLASMPKITQWLASPEPALRQRSIQELFRINRFQTFLGCCAALVYLNVNNWFVRFWLGSDFQAPFAWQIAFAANLAAASAGLMGLDLAARCCDQGIRVAGLTVFAASLLKLVLSWVAIKQSSILGLAIATVTASSCSMLILGWFTSRQLKISWWKLSVQNWLVAGGVVAGGALLQLHGPGGVAVKSVILTASFFVIALLVGIRFADVRDEAKVLSAMFEKVRTK